MTEDCWRREEGTGSVGFKGSPEVDKFAFKGSPPEVGKVSVDEGEEVFKILGRGTEAASSQISLGISIYKRNVQVTRYVSRRI